MTVGGQLHAPTALTLGKRHSTHCIGGWVDTRAGLVCAEKLAPLGFDPRTVQPVASLYTEYAIPAHKNALT